MRILSYISTISPGELNRNNIAKNIGFDFSEGSVREVFFINMLQNTGNTIYYSQVGDFLINEMFFEIGGKSKSKKQIKDHINSSYLVKDNILCKTKREIPLFLFGFMY